MKKISTKRAIALVALLVIVIITAGLIVALQGKTLVEWWKPAAICIVPACLAAALLGDAMRRLTHSEKRLLNAAAMLILSYTLIMGVFYTLNYCKSNPATATTQHALVIRKFTEERYSSKRVGRRYVRGEKYNVYRLEMRLPDESTKELDITAQQFVNTRKGQSLTLHIEDGFLGLPVIKSVKFPPAKSNTRKRNRRIPTLQQHNLQQHNK